MVIKTKFNLKNRSAVAVMYATDTTHAKILNFSYLKLRISLFKVIFIFTIKQSIFDQLQKIKIKIKFFTSNIQLKSLKKTFITHLLLKKRNVQ